MSSDAPSADAAFDRLQRRLIDLWPSIRTWSDDEQTVVVVPSYSIDEELLSASYAPLLGVYEERFLYLLLLLRQPGCRVVFVTSGPVDEVVLDYHLGLVPGPGASDARERLLMVSMGDGTFRPLTQKVLGRVDVVERILSAVADRARAHLIFFNVTPDERDLALALDIPIYGAAPRFSPLGTKSGCRKLFAEVGVPRPAGAEDLRDVDAVADAIVDLACAGAQRVVLKLDGGFAGFGNVTLDVRDVGQDVGVARERLAKLPPAFIGGLGEGAVVEELVEGDEVRSPSVQVRVTPLGEVELLSTHDQILGGPEGQTYMGARFPADPAYAPAIARYARRVGDRLAMLGVTGRLAIDFVVVREQRGWTVYAIEVNLRKGGTTHPFLTLQFLTDGSYEPDTAAFVVGDGSTRCYVATDGLHNAAYRGLGAERVVAACAAAGLGYDPGPGRGVVFHMLSGLRVGGRLGLTAIGRDPGDAEALYAATVEMLDDLARVTPA